MVGAFINSAGTLEIPNSTSLTFSAEGQIGHDTTSDLLLFATSTTDSPVVFASGTTTLYAFTATTSPIISGTVQRLPAHPLKQVVTEVMCYVTSATSLVLVLSDDGTNDMDSITCTTTIAQYQINTNSTIDAYEDIRIEWGSKTGDTEDVVVRIMGYRVSD